jgi:hypothetical protein
MMKDSRKLLTVRIIVHTFKILIDQNPIQVFRIPSFPPFISTGSLSMRSWWTPSPTQYMRIGSQGTVRRQPVHVSHSGRLTRPSLSRLLVYVDPVLPCSSVVAHIDSTVSVPQRKSIVQPSNNFGSGCGGRRGGRRGMLPFLSQLFVFF